MSRTHYEVAEHFAKRSSNRDMRGSNVFTSYGNERIFSYGTHFCMAYADDKRKVIVVNGDRYGVTTSRHQSEVRGALQSYLPKDYKQITVPFSVLRTARVDVESVDPLDTDSDYEFAYCKTHNEQFFADFNSAYMNLQEHKRTKDWECETQYEHRLGGSVFRARNIYEDYRNKSHPRYKYFLSGFDETHNTRSDGYFISELPHAVKTVAEGYESLKPKVVRDAIAAGLDVKRQGDAFAIPVENLNVRKMVRTRAHMEPISGYRYEDAEGNIYRSYPSYPRRVEVEWKYGPLGKVLDVPTFGNNSHGANEVAIDRYGHFYARGNLIHRPNGRIPEHKKIPLGKTWHRIVMNTAKGSWQATTARVD